MFLCEPSQQENDQVTDKLADATNEPRPEPEHPHGQVQNSRSLTQHGELKVESDVIGVAGNEKLTLSRDELRSITGSNANQL